MDGSRKERMRGRFDLRVTDLDTVTLMDHCHCVDLHGVRGYSQLLLVVSVLQMRLE